MCEAVQTSSSRQPIRPNNGGAARPHERLTTSKTSTLGRRGNPWFVGLIWFGNAFGLCNKHRPSRDQSVHHPGGGGHNARSRNQSGLLSPMVGSVKDCHCVVVRRFAVQKWISFEVVDVTPVVANHSYTLFIASFAVECHGVDNTAA
jgi:hypothetical protein